MAKNEFFTPRPEVAPTIYAYELIDVASHKGYLKVGYTEEDIKNRKISHGEVFTKIIS